MVAPDITIAIVAHNAAETIGRAITSALKTGPYPLLLVDDHSSDATAEIALEAGGNQITIIKSKGCHCVGAARQTALENINTPYGLWLDADDEILPGRPEAFRHALHNEGADLVYGEGSLIDSKTGAKKALTIPDFLNEQDGMIRNLERNWLPLLHCGFKTQAALSLGFDNDFTCAEDYDFLLRALMSRASTLCSSDAGYKYYHSANTLSRDLTKTRSFIKKGLAKHVLKEREALLAASSLTVAEQYFIMASGLIYEERAEHAEQYLTQIPEEDRLLPQYQKPLSSCVSFLMATAQWQQENPEGCLSFLKKLTDSASEPEVLNNIGCCYKQLGNHEKAHSFFSSAVKIKPNYADAAQNIASKSQSPLYYTTHPFRAHTVRSTYN